MMIMMAFASVFSFAPDPVRAGVNSDADAKGSELEVDIKYLDEERTLAGLYDEALRLPKKEILDKFWDLVKNNVQVTHEKFNDGLEVLAEEVEKKVFNEERGEKLTKFGRDAVISACWATTVAFARFSESTGYSEDKLRELKPRLDQVFSRKFNEKCDELRSHGHIHGGTKRDNSSDQLFERIREYEYMLELCKSDGKLDSPIIAGKSGDKELGLLAPVYADARAVDSKGGEPDKLLGDKPLWDKFDPEVKMIAGVIACIAGLFVWSKMITAGSGAIGGLLNTLTGTAAK